MPHKDIEKRRAYGKKHYKKNKAAYVARAMALNARNRNNIRQFIAEYLKENHCVDCGESDPIVLEFDHRDGSEKSFNIGDSVSIRARQAAGKVS